MTCTHETWQITPGTVKVTEHSKYGDTYLECEMRCISCHMISTATRVEYNNESSSDIVS